MFSISHNCWDCSEIFLKLLLGFIISFNNLVHKDVTAAFWNTIISYKILQQNL